MAKFFATISLLSVLSVVAGCSTAPQADYGAVELIAASGTITLDGQPLADAVVSFDAEDGQFSYGQTDDSGKYVLQLDSVKKGVTPGKKTVRISTTRKILGLNTDEEGGAEASGETESGAPATNSSDTERVPEKYNQKSELTAEVTSEQTTYDFELSSK